MSSLMPSPISCQKLARLAGVSVRTLHHYDRIGLLRPLARSEARYRRYGPAELLRLQQILFYKELGFALTEIGTILDAPDFDRRAALQGQQAALLARRDRLNALLTTIDNTIAQLNDQTTMLTNEELYAGFPNDQAEAYRREVTEKYGAATVEASEQHLRQLGKAGFEELKDEQKSIRHTLGEMLHLDPASAAVQQQVARHYANIVGFWGPSVAAESRLATYRGLAQLYLDDPRFSRDAAGVTSPAYAAFLSSAIRHFVAEEGS